MTTSTHVPAVPELPVTAGSPPPGLAAALDRGGAVMLRDAGVTDAAALAALADRLGLAAVDQPEPFAPRQALGHGVWSQPAWPRTAPMCAHHELGWQRQPPPYLLIACRRPSIVGGRTGVCDGRAVLALLPRSLVERAEHDGWSLIRRYSNGPPGLPWTDAFPGLDAAGVQAYATAEEISLQWGPDGLVTRRHRPAIWTASDGVPAWSNLLAFCSEWTMDPSVRGYLLATLGRDGLPFETTFGDGSPFTADDVETVNAAYDRASTHVSWRAGDVLLLDNLRTAHSMEPYTGTREMAILHAAPR